jgi:DNA-binding response OmpR family regulator
MSARILIVEDEVPVRTGLVDLLQAKGYQVIEAATGPEALIKAEGANPDLILLDVMIPGLSGFDVLKTLRARGLETPVVMLTAKGTEVDRVLGFELGVDDYVVKPFSILELMGRIQAVLRRSTSAPQPATASIGTLEVDFEGMEVRRGSDRLDLPPRAIELLRALLRAEGRVVSRDRLIDEVWGAGQVVNMRTVDNLIVKLRAAIEPNPDRPVHLFTVHGRGYRLVLP